jgi:hypothetical protein
LTERVDPDRKSQRWAAKNGRAEQIVAKLRQIEIQMAQGKSLALICKDAEISEQSYYRWRKE